jgi:hypothetical protein
VRQVALVPHPPLQQVQPALVLGQAQENDISGLSGHRSESHALLSPSQSDRQSLIPTLADAVWFSPRRAGLRQRLFLPGPHPRTRIGDRRVRMIGGLGKGADGICECWTPKGRRLVGQVVEIDC